MDRSCLADRLPPPPDDIGPAQPDDPPLLDSRLCPYFYPIMVGAAGYLAVYLLWEATRLGGMAHSTFIGDAFFIPMDLLVIFSTITASRRCRIDRRRFWSWAFVSVLRPGRPPGA